MFLLWPYTMMLTKGKESCNAYLIGNLVAYKWISHFHISYFYASSIDKTLAMWKKPFPFLTRAPQWFKSGSKYKTENYEVMLTEEGGWLWIV